MMAATPVALIAARSALAAGLCPIPPMEDGSKKPVGFWKEYQQRRPTTAELDRFYANGPTGVGLVCGEVSGGLELLEFEGRAVEAGVFEEYCQAAEAIGLDDLLGRIAEGFSERSPTGGFHLLYRCGEVSGNTKLARRPATETELAESPDDKTKVLIETRGEGGYVITAPSTGSVHPSGLPWEIVNGGFGSIITITPEERGALFDLARMFDTMPQPVYAPTPSRPPSSQDGSRPGDDFAARGDWHGDILEPAGYSLVFTRGNDEYWRRPNKQGPGHSVVLHLDSDLLVPFSSSTPFPDLERGYGKFSAYTWLLHDGNMTLAARALAAAGYGDQATNGVGRVRTPPSAPGGAPAGSSPEEGWPVLDPAAFHGLAGRVASTLGPHTEADPAGLLLTFLAFFGSAVGPGPHALADGSVHALRLFVALVGDTSRSRKGTTSARTRSVFELADPSWTHERVMSGFGSGEAIVDEVRDAKMGVDKDGAPVVLDKGVEDKRLLVLEGEFARILAVAAREGSTISAIIRDAWDLGRLAARARHQKSVATGAHVSIVTNVTVEELRRRLSETEMANGLANRFLFACVRRSKLLPGGGQVDPAVLHRLGSEVRSALEAARKITRVSRSAAAEARWAVMYAEMARGPGGLLGAITARAEAQALRLSVGYALLDGSDTVEEVHLEAAYAVWRFCEDSAAHVFGDALGDDVADRLLAAIRAEGEAGLDFTGQTEVFGRHIKAKRLAAARGELEGLGLISTVKLEPEGGRPRMVSRCIAKQAKQAKEPPT